MCYNIIIKRKTKQTSEGVNKMKWRKETQGYMWAHYYSEDGRWMAYDEDVYCTSNRKEYNPKTKKFEPKITCKHIWFLKDLKTDEIVFSGKTLKSCKEYAENN